jgi:hypothetical protein
VLNTFMRATLLTRTGEAIYIPLLALEELASHMPAKKPGSAGD